MDGDLNDNEEGSASPVAESRSRFNLLWSVGCVRLMKGLRVLVTCGSGGD